eukprot:192036-Karenia_brevis.AAC.1
MNLLFRFHSYLRPGVTDRLLVGQLVTPIPGAKIGYHFWCVNLHPSESFTPGKTGLYDEAV